MNINIENAEMQYIKNKKTGKIKYCAQQDLSAYAKDAYELVIGYVPEDAEFEELKLDEEISTIKTLRDYYSALPVAHRAALADIASKVSQAIENNDYELAEYLINNTQTPSGFESIKDKMLEIVKN